MTPPRPGILFARAILGPCAALLVLSAGGCVRFLGRAVPQQGDTGHPDLPRADSAAPEDSARADRPVLAPDRLLPKAERRTDLPKPPDTAVPDKKLPADTGTTSYLPDALIPTGPTSAIATWTLNGTPSSPWAASGSSTYVTAGDLTMTGVTYMTFANAFVGDNWPSGAIELGKYFEFSATASGGHAIRYDTVRFSLYNNFDGMCSWELRSSVDGYAAALDGGTESNIAQPGVPITASVAIIGTRTGTVTFRFYAYNNSGTTSPLQRGFRGSAPGGIDLKIWGDVK
jgi:hypothetical protein